MFYVHSGKIELLASVCQNAFHYSSTLHPPHYSNPHLSTQIYISLPLLHNRLGMTYAGLASTIGIHPTSAEEVVKLHITRASGKDPMVTAC